MDLHVASHVYGCSRLSDRLVCSYHQQSVPVHMRGCGTPALGATPCVHECAWICTLHRSCMGIRNALHRRLVHSTEVDEMPAYFSIRPSRAD